LFTKGGGQRNDFSDQVMGHADQRRSNSRVFAYVGALLVSVDISVIKTRVGVPRPGIELAQMDV